jgi:hypothetical protein
LVTVAAADDVRGALLDPGQFRQQLLVGGVPVGDEEPGEEPQDGGDGGGAPRSERQQPGQLPAGRGRTKGRIAAGADADVPVVRGDPVADIGSMTNVQAVFRAGLRARWQPAAISRQQRDSAPSDAEPITPVI